MNLLRRSSLLAALAFISLATLGGPALAQEYPTRPIRIIVPFPAASLSDAIVRSVTHRMTDLSVPFIIDDRPGGNTFIGMGAAANAEPDGYTLGLSTISTDVVNPMVYAKMPYDPNNLVPLAVLGYSPYVLIVPADLKVNTVVELMAMAKAKPGGLNFASAGTGNSTHLVSEKFLKEAGLSMVHVPFAGSSLVHQSLMRGDVQVYSDVLTSALPHIRSGRFKALAVTSQERHPVLPGVPTMIESGFPNFIMTAWYGLQAPRKTPQAAMDRLARSIDKALLDPGLIAEYAAKGMVISPPGGPKLMAQVIAADRERWGPIIKSLNIKLD